MCCQAGCTAIEVWCEYEHLCYRIVNELQKVLFRSPVLHQLVRAQHALQQYPEEYLFVPLIAFADN